MKTNMQCLDVRLACSLLNTMEEDEKREVLKTLEDKKLLKELKTEYLKKKTG